MVNHDRTVTTQKRPSFGAVMITLMISGAFVISALAHANAEDKRSHAEISPPSSSVSLVVITPHTE